MPPLLKISSRAWLILCMGSILGLFDASSGLTQTGNQSDITGFSPTEIIPIPNPPTTNQSDITGVAPTEIIPVTPQVDPVQAAQSSATAANSALNFGFSSVITTTIRSPESPTVEQSSVGEVSSTAASPILLTPVISSTNTVNSPSFTSSA
ncbi:MAG: hypothetical protein RLZZ435_283, partial [Cyanobacteriota bacterium]